jgi:putative PIN family toxin of toxin-antitoxin system
MAKQRLVLDTNIVVRLLDHPGGKRSLKILLGDYSLYTSEYILAECRYILCKKFGQTAQRAKASINAYQKLCHTVHDVDMAKMTADIRDPKDQPILALCTQFDIDILVTSDDDFVALNLKKPKIFTFDQKIFTFDQLIDEL